MYKHTLKQTPLTHSLNTHLPLVFARVLFDFSISSLSFVSLSVVPEHYIICCSLHGSYLEAAVSELGTEALTAAAVRELLRANREKASRAHLYRELAVCFDCDIRLARTDCCYL